MCSCKEKIALAVGEDENFQTGGEKTHQLMTVVSYCERSKRPQ
jgi:hypothetical protein